MDRPSTGRLSDIASQLAHRADWSDITSRIRTLEPGETIPLSRPPRVPMKHFRSVILTAGRRFHAGDWKLTTRTIGDVIHCFLAPRS